MRLNLWTTLAFFKDLQANYSADMSRMFARHRALHFQHHVDYLALTKRIDQLDELVKERTDIAADVSINPRDRNHVIVVGRYNNIDYVQTFSLENQGFAALIEHLQSMKRHGVVRQLDAPPVLRAVFERDVNRQ